MIDNEIHVNFIRIWITQNPTHKQTKKDEGTMHTKFKYKDDDGVLH